MINIFFILAMEKAADRGFKKFYGLEIQTSKFKKSIVVKVDGKS